MRKVACWLFSSCPLRFPSGKEIVVASYNVENYLLGDRQKDGIVIENAPKPEEEIAAVVKVLSQIQPDIVGLIEIGDESMLDDFRQRLKTAGLDYSYREWVKGADEATPHLPC